jgi:hypothetical protein
MKILKKMSAKTLPTIAVIMLGMSSVAKASFDEPNPYPRNGYAYYWETAYYNNGWMWDNLTYTLVSPHSNATKTDGPDPIDSRWYLEYEFDHWS